MPLPGERPHESGASDPLRRHAFERIYEAIYDGTLRGGENVSEEELGRWLEVSRQPIRSALLQLERYGLVELAPGRQPRVLEIDDRRINQLFLLRGMFLVRVLPRSVSKLTDRDIQGLDRHMTAMQESAETGAWSAMTDALFELFAALVEADGNAVISARLRRTQWELMDFLRPGSSARFDPSEFLRQVQAVVTAARTRDEHAMRSAIEAITDDTFQRFRTTYRLLGR